MIEQAGLEEAGGRRRVPLARIVAVNYIERAAERARVVASAMNTPSAEDDGVARFEREPPRAGHRVGIFLAPVQAFANPAFFRRVPTLVRSRYKFQIIIRQKRDVDVDARVAVHARTLGRLVGRVKLLVAMPVARARLGRRVEEVLRVMKERFAV